MTESRQDQPRPGAPILRIYSLHRRQWAVVVGVALTIGVVNKAVIHDHGNNWLSLAVVAFFVGLVVAHLAGWLGITPRADRSSRQPTEEPPAG